MARNQPSPFAEMKLQALLLDWSDVHQVSRKCTKMPRELVIWTFPPKKKSLNMGLWVLSDPIGAEKCSSFIKKCAFEVKFKKRRRLYKILQQRWMGKVLHHWSMHEITANKNLQSFIILLF